MRNVQFQSAPGSTPPSPNSDVPKTPLLTPNIRPKPTKKNTIVPTEKSIRFFIRILIAFLDRVKPHSTIAKPGCIKKTRNAATHVQTMFMFV